MLVNLCTTTDFLPTVFSRVKAGMWGGGGEGVGRLGWRGGEGRIGAVIWRLFVIDCTLFVLLLGKAMFCIFCIFCVSSRIFSNTDDNIFMIMFGGSCLTFGSSRWRRGSCLL